MELQVNCPGLVKIYDTAVLELNVLTLDQTATAKKREEAWHNQAKHNQAKQI